MFTVQAFDLQLIDGIQLLSEPLEPERARAVWCLPPAPFFGFLYRSFSDELK